MSGGKLPLRFLFLLGFLAGVSAVYFGRNSLLIKTDLLGEDVLYQMKYMEVDSSVLFRYVLCRRAKDFLILIIMSTTYLGLIFCGGMAVKYGFSLGLFLSTAFCNYGIKGILLGIVGVFPHYMMYAPAVIMLLRWCEDIYRNIYFYHNITGQGKKSLPGKLGKLVIIFGMIVFGCILECFINPNLVKCFLQSF